jgi:hypothetical protein
MSRNIELSKILPKDSLFVLGVSVVLGLFIYLALIMPGNSYSAKLDTQAGDLRNELVERQKLKSYYESLLRSKVKDAFNLPAMPDALTGDKGLEEVITDMKTLAKDSGMEVVSVSPNVHGLQASFSGGGTVIQNIAVELKLSGDYAGVRRFLLSAGAQPYIEHIEELELERDLSKDRINFRIKAVVLFI